MVQQSGRGWGIAEARSVLAAVPRVVSGNARRSAIPRAHRRWLGEPPPRRPDRLSPRGKPGPSGATEPATASPDRRPAPSTRGAGQDTRTASVEPSDRDRHTGHDSPLASETDRSEIRRQRPPTARPSDDATGGVRPRGADGGRESDVGLDAHPRRAVEPRPPDRPEVSSNSRTT